ncbi:hypothetical protein FBU30_005626 [Linnemannia zychae]|nr:hypothetical protein FBU30_005626 [Linnemannia zychae]
MSDKPSVPPSGLATLTTPTTPPVPTTRPHDNRPSHSHHIVSSSTVTTSSPPLSHTSLSISSIDPVQLQQQQQCITTASMTTPTAHISSPAPSSILPRSSSSSSSSSHMLAATTTTNTNTIANNKLTATMATTKATTAASTEAEMVIATRIDASPIVLFTLQYSVAVVQGVTIYILSVMFSMFQLVSGQLSDPPSSSGSTTVATTTTATDRRRAPRDEKTEWRQRRQQQRRKRWSGSASGNGSGSTTWTTRTWAQNLIAWTSRQQQQQHADSEEPFATTMTATATSGEEGTWAQRVEVLQFLGSTIARLVGYSPTTFSTTTSSSSSTPGQQENTSNAALAGGALQGMEDTKYSSRLRRALVKTLSGHALPRGMKRVTFNDHVQFHTTTTFFHSSRARFGDEDDNEDDNEDEVDNNDEEDASSTSSSPVLRFFSAGFSSPSGVDLSPQEPLSASPIPATAILGNNTNANQGTGKKNRKHRPPSIMPAARDRKALQELDELEEMKEKGEEARNANESSRFSIVSNGRSIPISTLGSQSTPRKTITIGLPPLSRPRRQQRQQQQQQSPLPSPMMTPTVGSAIATSTIAAASATTTSAITTMTTMATSTNCSPTGGTPGLATALLSSLMMPAAPAPISDAARTLLTTTTSPPLTPLASETIIAAAHSDSDSSKSSGLGSKMKRTKSTPTKIGTFLQQRRLAKQQQQMQQQNQPQGSPGEYTTSPQTKGPPQSNLSIRLPSTLDATSARNIKSPLGTGSDSPLPSCSTTPTHFQARSTPGSSTSSPHLPMTPTTPSSMLRPRSLSSLQTSVSSVVMTVMGGGPPPPVPTSLTTCMSRSLSSSNNPTSPRLGPTGFVPGHQRRRSASVDLGKSMGIPSLVSPTKTSGPEPVAPVSSENSPSSGGRRLMYKLAHPQRYKREVGLQQQLQQQQQRQEREKDTNSPSSATSSPSASQIALSPTFSTTSISTTCSINHNVQESSPSRPTSPKVTATTTYPFSQSFTDLPVSLSYLSDDPSPTNPLCFSDLSSSSSLALTEVSQGTTESSLDPQDPALGSASDKSLSTKENTTPPLSLYFPSPTTQHRPPSSSLGPSSPSRHPLLSNMKDTILQRGKTTTITSSPPSSISFPTTRSHSQMRRPTTMVEDHDDQTHTTFASCGFAISSTTPAS